MNTYTNEAKARHAHTTTTTASHKRMMDRRRRTAIFAVIAVWLIASFIIGASPMIDALPWNKQAARPTTCTLAYDSQGNSYAENCYYTTPR